MGIWMSPTEYIEFSKTDTQGLLEEIYTSANAQGFDPGGWLGLMPDPDPVLRKSGDGVSVLRDLTADDKVMSCMQSRKLGILKKKDFLYEPGKAETGEAAGESEKVCKNLEKDLEGVDLYNVFSQVLDAPYYGSSVVEVIWRPEKGLMRIEALKPRPAEWFAWDNNHNLVFRASGSSEGDPVPFGKAVTARHFPDASNPYGLRLLSRCLWPVAVKKGGIRFWTILCERFGMPWVIGKARPGADKTERGEILSALSGMVQDAVAVVSGGTEVDLKGVEGRGGDMHSALVRFMNNAISTVIMGQTLTAELPDNSGSRAAAQVHEDVLDDYREADETLVVKFMRDLGRMYTTINSPTAHYPKFRYREPADYSAQAELDNRLYTVGVRFEPAYFERKYDLSEGEFTVEVQEAQSLSALAGSKLKVYPDQNRDSKLKAFSLPSAAPFTPEQQAIEDLADSVMPDEVEALGVNEEQIIAAVEASESYEEAIGRLLDLYPSLETKALQEALERVILNADLFGRWTAGEELRIKS